MVVVAGCLIVLYRRDSKLGFPVFVTKIITFIRGLFPKLKGDAMSAISEIEAVIAKLKADASSADTQIKSLLPSGSKWLTPQLVLVLGLIIVLAWFGRDDIFKVLQWIVGIVYLFVICHTVERVTELVCYAWGRKNVTTPADAAVTIATNTVTSTTASK